MLTKLRLKNFKSWEDTGEMRLAPFTGLFGTNSSGKSSILQALLLLKQTAESFDRNQVLDFGDDNSYVNLGTFYDIVHGKDINETIDFELSWDYDQNFAIVEKSPFTQDVEMGIGNLLYWVKDMRVSTKIGMANQTLEIIKLKYDFNGSETHDPIKYPDKIQNFEFRLEVPEQSLADYRLFAPNYPLQLTEEGKKLEAIDVRPVKNYGMPLNISRYYQGTDFLLDVANEYEKQIEKIQYLGPLRDTPKRIYIDTGSQPKELGTRGEATISALLASRKMPKISWGEGQLPQALEEIVADWLKKLGLVESFRLRPLAENRREYEVLVKRYNDSTEVLLSEVGFGVSQILPILVLCYYAPKGSTILLEQPEIHLHPSVQGGLADVFIDVIRNRNIQLIVESHSEHLLERLQRRIAEEVITKDETALYFCRAGEGRSEIEELQLNEYGEISNWPEDFFGDPMGDLAARTLKIIERQQAALAESQKVAANS